jgi:hypothetical protein
MSTPLVSPRFLFRFAAACRQCTARSNKEWPALGAEHRLPDLMALDGQRNYAEVRAGWNEAGLWFAVEVMGKRQEPWCRATRLDESDGLWLWIDTRDTHNVHRASRFCHQFVFVPFGGGAKQNQPMATMLAIRRARENPKPLAEGTLKARSEALAGGYRLEAHVPAGALTGFDPVEQPRLGFTYAVRDSELGIQSYSCDIELPYDEDPSLWATLELSE